MNYALPADPASPTVSLACLRMRARRVGFLIAADRYAPTFSIVDARLRRPLAGLDHVSLGEVARAINTVRALPLKHPTPRRKQKGRPVKDLRALVKIFERGDDNELHEVPTA